MKEIVKFPNRVLRKVTKEVRELDEKTLKEIEELKEILRTSENGAGLAAPQIGISKSFLAMKNQSGVGVLVNPSLDQVFGEKVYPKIRNEDGSEEEFLEGCLSFPDLFGTVKRYLKIKVSFDEILGDKLKRKEKILEGFEAIVWQHEVDHLAGILFVDHIKEEGGDFFVWKEKEKIKTSVERVLEQEK